jgi:hypothetical protein
MSDKASTIRKPSADAPLAVPRARDPLADPKTPFAAREDRLLSGIQPGAVGSTLVLLALIGGIGYGGWSVLQEVQRVQLSPVDQTPLVLSELDPLESAMSPSVVPEAGGADMAGVYKPPSSEWYDRLQRPEALDTPVLVARDGPISTLDPDRSGVYAGFASDALPKVDETVATPDDAASPTVRSGVAVVAVRPAWVRVEDSRGTLYSGILNGGERFDVPADAIDPRVDVGDSGSVYFTFGGRAFGPAGPKGAVTDDIPLSTETLAARFAPASAGDDADLASLLASLDAVSVEADPVSAAIASALEDSQPGTPKVLADAPAGVTIVATGEAWVRVRTPTGTTLFETIMQPGDTYRVPRTEAAPTIRAGNAGAIYFSVNGETFGPYGAPGGVADDLALSADAVATQLARADLESDAQLARIVAELQAAER